MSWIIRHKETKAVVVEIFDKRKMKYLNTIVYEAVPAIQYLKEFNESVKPIESWPTSMQQMGKEMQEQEIARLTGRLT